MNYAFRLAVVADEATLRAYKLAPDSRTELDRAWDSTQPFVLRRRYFPTFPRVLRVSRKHLEIQCEEPSESNPERTFWISDLSANGTWLNGALLEKGTRAQLKDGDEILIINDDLADGSRATFGFRFTIFNEGSGPTPMIPDPPAHFIHEFKHKAREDLEQKLKKSKKRSRDLEYSESDGEDRLRITPSLRRRSSYLARADSDNEYDNKPLANNKRRFEDTNDTDMSLDSKADPSPLVSKKSDRIMKQWTPEEEQRLVEIMATSEGKSWKEIAIHFPHRSPDAVRNKFKKMSETDKVAKSFWAATISKQQARAAALAAQVQPNLVEELPPSLDKDNMMMIIEEPNLGVVENTAKKEVPVASKEEKQEEEEDRRRKLWTPEEDEQLRQLIVKLKPSSNEDWEVIASKLGRTVKSVKHKFNDHNLKHLLDT